MTSKPTSARKEPDRADRPAQSARLSVVGTAPREQAAGETSTRFARARKIYTAITTHPYSLAFARFIFDCNSHADIRAGAAAIRLSVFLAIAIVLSVLVAPYIGMESDWGFREGFPLTMFSVFLLFVIGHFCFRIRESLGTGDASAVAWKILGISFIFFAFDDWLRIHETADHTIHKVFRIHETEFTDHLDDAIIVMYGVAVAAIILRNVRALLRFWRAIYYFIPAAILATAHSAVDIVIASRSLLVQYFPKGQKLEDAIMAGELLEESCKLFAEVFIVAAIILCFTLVRDGKIQPADKPA